MSRSSLLAMGLCFLSAMACTNPNFSAVQQAASEPATVSACTTGQVASSRGCEAPISCPSIDTVSDNVCVAPASTSTVTTVSATPTPSPACPDGQAMSDFYGCLPLNSCDAGQGWYQDQCIDLHGHYNICRAYCPREMVATSWGCLPQTRECPPCMGEDDFDFCHKSIHYWDFINGGF